MYIYLYGRLNKIFQRVLGAHKKPELGQAPPYHLVNSYGSNTQKNKTKQNKNLYIMFGYFWDPESSTSGARAFEHFDPDPVVTTGINSGGWTLHRAVDRSLALQLILPLCGGFV